jgi:N-acyl-D-amino-acid deacylase
MRRTERREYLSRRAFLEKSGAAVAGLAAAASRADVTPAFDLVLKGGTIVDGTGGAPFPADLGITGDRIAAVGQIAATQGRRVIDVSGLHVAPGFIDIHTHSDHSILAYPSADSRVRQGITTELTGNCGSSAAPLPAVAKGARVKTNDHGVLKDWADVASYLARIERTKVSVNQALLVGQGTLRANAIGSASRPLRPEEMRSVVRALEAGLAQGAFGLSTGLEYVPGTYTPADEIVELARVVARRGGLYSSHIRDEESRVVEAVQEAVDVGRRAGVRVQVSHLKTGGEWNWPKQPVTLELLEEGRRDGIAVRADAYPYTAFSTSLDTLVPAWAREGGAPRLLKRLEDATDRPRLRAEMIATVKGDIGDWTRIVISRVRSEKNRWTVGKDMAGVAAEWKMEPADALLRLVAEEEASVSYVGHAMSAENVELVLGSSLVMVGSDGYSIAPTGRAASARPHPRSYGTCPRVLAHYCRDRRVFDLPTAIRKMTSLPADQIGLADRGLVARGKIADLVVFDAARVKDVATFDDPQRYPSGIPWVLVNGVVVVEAGAHTRARPGRVLRRA